MMHRLASVKAAFGATRRQSGQALVEALAALLGLAVLWVALHWLAHYQDAALSATHASRHAAFVASRGELADNDRAVAAPFFTGVAHRWTDRRGRAALEFDTSVSVFQQRLQPLSVSAQPGVGQAHAATLRREWSLADTGILRAGVGLEFTHADPVVPPEPDSSLLKLRVFDHSYPSLVRSTSILTGAGHAVSDTEVQSRVAQSSLAWAGAHAASRAAGSEINLRATGVEAGWGSRSAGFDWLHPWRGQVPEHLITEYASIDGGN